MITLLNIGITPIKVNGIKNYTTELEVIGRAPIEASGENGQGRLLSPHNSFHVAFVLV